MLQKKREHTFTKVKQIVSYAIEVTTFVEKERIKRDVDVKTKKLFMWLSLVEVYVDEACADKVTFKMVPVFPTPLMQLPFLFENREALSVVG